MHDKRLLRKDKLVDDVRAALTDAEPPITPGIVSAYISIDELQSQDLAFLGTRAVKGVSTWKSTVRVNGVEIQFKLDTVAEVTAICERSYRRLGLQRKLQRPSKALSGPAAQSLTVLGQLDG